MNKKRSILIVNDDGIYGLGLKPLAKALRSLGRVTVVVPEQERSAASQAITLHKPLRVRALENPFYIINGTPADCVRFGALTLLKGRVDVVVSGINRGSNMGSDILYSGTVGAAREGALLGFSSMAVSLAHKDKGHYDTAARFIRQTVAGVLKTPLPSNVCLNINVPDRPWTRIRGVAITRLGKRIYGREHTARTDPRGQAYYWLAGHTPVGVPVPGTDVTALHQGKISVTPLRLDMTDLDLVWELQRAGAFYINGKR